MAAASSPDLLESRAEIADLVHRYALNVRSDTTQLCESLMVEDVEFEICERNPLDPGTIRQRAHLVGRKATLDHIGQQRPNLAICPLIHNLLIDVDGTRAESSYVMEGRTFPAGQEVIGEYSDSYRFDDRWRFTRRTFVSAHFDTHGRRLQHPAE